jgi:IclR family KDG regulon transcriptional repressor
LNTIRSVQRAIKVLKYVCNNSTPVGLSQISRGVKLDKTTTWRLLITLEKENMVQQDPVSKKYIPAANISNLSNTWRSDVRQIARPYLEELLHETGETVCLIVAIGLERLCIEVLRADKNINAGQNIGYRAPIYKGASGRVLMAYRPIEEVERILDETGLEQSTPQSITDRDIYMSELEKTRARGFAATSGDLMLGLSAVSSPIFDKQKELASALVVKGSQARMPNSIISKMSESVLTTASAISEELGVDKRIH